MSNPRVTIEEVRGLFEGVCPIMEGLDEVPFVNYKRYNPEYPYILTT